MLLSTAPAVTQQTGQPSLAEIARQSESAKLTARRATRSYTNADLKPSPRVEPAATVPSAGYVSATLGRAVTPEEMVKRSQEVAEGQSGGRQSEAHWRGRADSLRAQVNALQSRLKDLAVANPARDANPVAKRLHDVEIAGAQQGVAGLMQQWTRLEESARVANVQDVWLAPRPQFQ